MSIEIGSPEWQRRRAAMMGQVRAIIARDGWYIQGVFPREGDSGVPFAYTVGLSAAGLPELVISGVGAPVAQTLLDAAARRSLADEISDGDTVEVLTVALRAVQAPKAEINFARELFPNRPVWAIQLVWPDDAGNYPWHPQWSLGDVQPVFEKK